MRRAVLWMIALAALTFVVQAEIPEEEGAPGGALSPRSAEEFRIVYPYVLDGGRGPEAGRRGLIHRKEGRTPEGRTPEELLRLVPGKRQELVGTLGWRRPQTAVRGLPIRPCLVEEGASGAENPCAVGRELSRMGPCKNAEDCRAFELWKDTFGQPKTVPVEPGED